MIEKLRVEYVEWYNIACCKLAKLRMRSDVGGVIIKDGKAKRALEVKL